MQWVIIVVIIAVVLLAVHVYRANKSPKHNWTRSARRADILENLGDQIAAKMTNGTLQIDDAKNSAVTARRYANQQKAERVPHPTLEHHKANYCWMFDWYARRFHDLAYNGGRNLDRLAKEAESWALAQNVELESALRDHNRLMRETGQPELNMTQFKQMFGGN